MSTNLSLLHSVLEGNKNGTKNGRKFTLTYSTKLPEVVAVVPGLVQHLAVTQDASSPSLTLNWDAPANVLECGEVLQYCIRITSDDDDDDTAAGHALSKEVVVEGDTTMMELSSRDGLQPLRGYMFEVRAKSCKHATGNWSKVDGFVGK